MEAIIPLSLEMGSACFRWLKLCLEEYKGKVGGGKGNYHLSGPLLNIRICWADTGLLAVLLGGVSISHLRKGASFKELPQISHI
jgi:hypothetical protein